MGVGSNVPASISLPGLPGVSITMVESPLDEETLQRIADVTNAKYYRATDGEGLRDIYAEINALEKSEVEVLHFTRYQELMAWLLVPALALLLLDLILTQTVFKRIP